MTNINTSNNQKEICAFEFVAILPTICIYVHYLENTEFITIVTCYIVLMTNKKILQILMRKFKTRKLHMNQQFALFAF